MTVLNNADSLALGSSVADKVYAGNNQIWTPTQQFNPLSIGWHSAAWADDPGWNSPSSGGAVSQWDDGSGNGRHFLAGLGEEPAYIESDASFNGHACLRFDDGAGEWMQQNAYTAVSGTSELFVVARVRSVSANKHVVCGPSGNRRGYFIDSNNQWTLNGGSAGPTGSGVVATNAAHAMRCRFVSGNDLMWLDGTSIFTGNNGDESCVRLRLATHAAATPSNFTDVDIAFIGHKASALTAQEVSDLNAWATDYYGIS